MKTIYNIPLLVTIIMRTAITSLLVFVSISIFAHEDTYKAIQLSNLHLKIMVGYEDSYQLKIAESYAPLINDFIKEIDSTQKVFIQFEEDYCALKDEYYLLSVGSFKNSVIPLGFPFSYPYDLGYIDTEYGINIILKNDDFKLFPILKLISYGLRNNEYILENQNFFELDSENIHPITNTIMNRDYSKRIKSIGLETIDSLINCKETETEFKYLSRKIPLKDLNDYGFQIILRDDSVVIANETDENIFKISGLQCIAKEQQSHSFFIFNSENTFYHLDSIKGNISKECKLTFSIKRSCKNIVYITYDVEKELYEISNGYPGTNSTVNCYSRGGGMIKN